MQLYHGDVLDKLRELPDGCVDLVLTDPPYNIGKAKWDKIDGYIDWCDAWLTECARVLKDNGVLVLWHNDMPQIAQLMVRIRERGLYDFISFCVWDKGDGYRAQAWKQRDPDGKTALRSWFNICEYCLEFAKTGSGAKRATGLAMINSNPACYAPIKAWIDAEMKRLGLTKKDIADRYTAYTGKKPYMLSHYFCDSQFEIQTREIWENVYMALGFSKEYEALRQEYEALRQEYEALRYYHRVDDHHHNVWRRPVLNFAQKESGHPCEKPVDLLARIIRVNCQKTGVVLDCFMGGGSTGVAAVQEGRDFIGIERDAHWFDVARERIEWERVRPKQIGLFNGTGAVT